MYSNTTNLNTDFGVFKCFSVKEGNKEHLVLYKGEVQDEECLVRIHSECLTGDVFKSQKCDCGYQLDSTLKKMSEQDNGIFIYLRQEGRDIGLFNKIEAYHLQEQGFDTVEANVELGLPIDDRNYDIAAQILKKLAPSKIKLLTNNPFKLDALISTLSIRIERVAMHSPVCEHNEHYLKTKVSKLHHIAECELCNSIK